MGQKTRKNSEEGRARKVASKETKESSKDEEYGRRAAENIIQSRKGVGDGRIERGVREERLIKNARLH